MNTQEAHRRLNGFLKWADERLSHNTPFLDVAHQGDQTLDDIAKYVRSDTTRAAETVPWLNWFAAQLKNNPQLCRWFDERVKKMRENYADIGKVNAETLPPSEPVSEAVQQPEDNYAARHLNGFVDMSASHLEKDGSKQARNETLNALIYHGTAVLQDIDGHVRRDLKVCAVGAVSALNAFSLAVSKLNTELWSSLELKANSMRAEYAQLGGIPESYSAKPASTAPVQEEFFYGRATLAGELHKKYELADKLTHRHEND